MGCNRWHMFIRHLPVMHSRIMDGEEVSTGKSEVKLRELSWIVWFLCIPGKNNFCYCLMLLESNLYQFGIRWWMIFPGT